MDGAKDARESGVEVAKEILVRRLAVRSVVVGGRERAGVVPHLMRNPGRLREEQRDNEQQAREQPHLARHSSRPAMKMSFGSFLPMNTRIDSFDSFFVQGLPMSPPIIMCTPWNTTRRGLPFIHSTPL